MKYDLRENGWWRMNKRKFNTSSIEWTAECGGVVRAQLDSLEPWRYRYCPYVTSAEAVGWQIIEEQKRMRMMKDDFDNLYDPNYQGA